MVQRQPETSDASTGDLRSGDHPGDCDAATGDGDHAFPQNKEKCNHHHYVDRETANLTPLDSQPQLSSHNSTTEYF
ncbi:hypothetical protein ANN_12297 [Periplaneta americana]|uniref:Uncharacterized protein n=1 Tax=Periplaneta americana TaxID=6978 RepID=A0ABQ8TGF0_PERAM|nr:hypothetical protein ANN_12297 [Periplaneta americana]